MFALKIEVKKKDKEINDLKATLGEYILGDKHI